VPTLLLDTCLLIVNGHYLRMGRYTREQCLFLAETFLIKMKSYSPYGGKF
jgi:hypothetical protein